MAIESSGAISLGTTAGTDRSISAEFGGDVPHSLSEYYDKGNAPASGEIQMGADFYGTSDMQSSTGTTTTDGDYTVRSFTESGFLVLTEDLDCEYLICGGGGGTGGGTPTTTTVDPGGGGAGGAWHDGGVNNDVTLSSGEYVVTVGVKGAVGANAATAGSNGTDTIFNGFRCGGGGGGGSGDGTDGAWDGNDGSGTPGCTYGCGGAGGGAGTSLTSGVVGSRGYAGDSLINDNSSGPYNNGWRDFSENGGRGKYHTSLGAGEHASGGGGGGGISRSGNSCHINYMVDQPPMGPPMITQNMNGFSGGNGFPGQYVSGCDITGTELKYCAGEGSSISSDIGSSWRDNSPWPNSVGADGMGYGNPGSANEDGIVIVRYLTSDADHVYV
jgi:hypothetical protein